MYGNLPGRTAAMVSIHWRVPMGLQIVGRATGQGVVFETKKGKDLGGQDMVRQRPQNTSTTTENRYFFFLGSNNKICFRLFLFQVGDDIVQFRYLSFKISDSV